MILLLFKTTHFTNKMLTIVKFKKVIAHGWQNYDESMVKLWRAISGTRQNVFDNRSLRF